eukprot:3233331-Pyramimonas_sp.AAC.1
MPTGPFWGGLGGLLGRLGALESRQGETANTVWKPKQHQSCVLGGLLGRLGGVLDHREAVLGVFKRSFGDSEPSWT